MAKAKTTNLLIGAKIIIDYPNRWQGAKDEETRKRLRAEAEASKEDFQHGAHYFGETAIIIAYNHNTESGKEYDVVLDSTREIVSLAYCWFTVTEMPKPEAEIVAVLSSILEILHAIKNKIK